MKKYKMAKWKKILYLGGLLIGVLLNIISILFAYRVDNDPLLNYLIGFSASLIITVIFAFLLELIAIKEQNDKLSKKRKMFLLPIKSYISALFMHCAFMECWQNEKRNIRIMISLTYSKRRLIHIAFTSNRLSTITETANCLTKHSTTKMEYRNILWNL